MNHILFQPKVRPEIYPLTGIRALAAFWVLLFHLHGKLAAACPQGYALFKPVIINGYLGVDLFFILSGFIISYNYADRLSVFTVAKYRDFLWLRLARLWPVHLAILACYAALLLLAAHFGTPLKHTTSYSVAKLWQNVALIQSWWVPIHESWNVPAWSISCEWAAYLLFPVLVSSGAVTRSVRRALMPGATALLLMALLLQNVHADGNNQYGLLRIAGEFVAGTSLCRLFHANVGQSWNWNLIIPLGVATAVLLLGFLLPYGSLVAYWCVPCLALVVLGLAYGQSVWSRLLSTRPFLFGGYVSYSLYMVHTLCFIILEKSFPRIEARPWSFAVDLTVAILAASATFYLIEEPCRIKMRALLPAALGKSPDAASAWPERFGSKE